MLLSSFFFHSCFLVNVPVSRKDQPVRDTVNVYHFIVTRNRGYMPDTILLASYRNESREALSWITRQAGRKGHRLIFREQWALNRDTSFGHTFYFHLPTTKLSILTRSNKSYEKWVNEKTRNEKRRRQLINWQQDLILHLAGSCADTMLASRILEKVNNRNSGSADLFMVHVLNASRSRVLGFYNRNSWAFIGSNYSRTIAHETIHHLGAPDLYIHKYWPGRRRRLVNEYFRDEIMNSSHIRNRNCNNFFLGEYTVYCLGWADNMDKRYLALMNMNLMAVINHAILLR